MISVEPNIADTAKLSINDVCREIGICRASLYNYMADGLIKKQTRRLNARPFFYGHEVKRFWKVM